MVRNKNKKVFFIILDTGLHGTMSRLIEEGSEEGYVHIEYYQPNRWFPKKIILDTPVRRQDCHLVFTTKNWIGIEEQLWYIYTNEQGSLVSGILDNDLMEKNRFLTEQVRNLQKQVTASKQEATDARSGLGKSLESIKQVSKSSRSNDNIGGLGGFSRPFGSRSDMEDEF